MRKAMKILLLAILMAASGCSGYVLGMTDKPTQILSPLEPPRDEIEVFRTERQQLRQMQLSQLNEMIHQEGVEEEIVAMAQRRQLELMQWAEQETNLEGILSLRGFSDPVVTVHDDSANILLRAESVSRQQTAVILDLVVRETGFSAGNVKIIPIN